MTKWEKAWLVLFLVCLAALQHAMFIEDIAGQDFWVWPTALIGGLFLAAGKEDQ